VIGRLREVLRHGCDALRWRCLRVQPLVDDPNAWYATTTPLLWAHAGGGRFHSYGNAREDVDESIAQGFPVIEVDISLTSDGVPVLSHRFQPCGQDLYACVPTEKQFLETPIDGCYTPLTFAQFVERYRSFDGYFALDAFSMTKSNPSFDFPAYLARTYPPNVLGKMIYLVTGQDCAECLSASHPFAALHYAVPEWIFSSAGAFCCGAFMRYLASCGIKSASLEVPVRMRQDFCRHAARIGRVVAEMKRWGIWASAFGVETVEEINRWRDIGVEVFNVDRVQPSAFQEKGV